jgi:hypothetical protein
MQPIHHRNGAEWLSEIMNIKNHDTMHAFYFLLEITGVGD